MNSSASSRRIPRGSARICAESAERSPDVRRSPPENNFGGSSPDSRGTGRSPPVFARICAEPRRKVFHRANSPAGSWQTILRKIRLPDTFCPSKRMFVRRANNCLPQTSLPQTKFAANDNFFELCSPKVS